MSRDITCSICGTDLLLQGDNIRSYAEPTSSASNLGKEIVSLECGHRMHRSCLIEWFQISPNPTCPMCRSTTEWKPQTEENRKISLMMARGWDSLGNAEKRIIYVAWGLAVCLTLLDPVGFTLASSFLMLFTPPFLYPQMAILMASLKSMIIPASATPGLRIVVGIGIASIITIMTVFTHDSIT